MLRDSWSAPGSGHHVEQVEIVFAPGAVRARVPAAWEEIVAKTEALQISFLCDPDPSGEIEFVSSVAPVTQLERLPDSWDSWLSKDRHRPLLIPHQVPWRAVYWPRDGRFLWTIHHALLDGRSITAVLRSLIARLAGGEAEELKLSKWHPPSLAAIELAGQMFQKDFPSSSPLLYLTEDSRDGQAVRLLGGVFGEKLGKIAAELEVTAATILIWAWGQALAESLGNESVIVEQVRSGPPQPGTAGFTMHTLPLVIPRAFDAGTGRHLQELRARLLALRSIEGISPDDFPPGVFPDVDHVGSSVIMVERGTLRHLIGGGEMVESIQLHENKGESLMATAHILPDLRLEVEGPGRHGLLEAWIRVLEGLVLPQRTLTARL
jgi:hypothetical protein